jgi:putative SOS response-associated peptidase YedK
MCGRFTLTLPPEVLTEVFGTEGALPPSLRPRFNVAPTDEVPIIRRERSQVEDAKRIVAMARWGLIPSGAKDPKTGAKMINARQETLFQRAPFASAVRSRRCLVPADGFFEWKTIGKVKQPYWIRVKGARVFAMAGIWDRWRAPDGTPVDSCSVITTEPNALVERVHDRMPVILEEKDWALWLDPRVTERTALARLLCPLAAEKMTMEPVSPRANSVQNDDPGCVEIVAPITPIEEAHPGAGGAPREGATRAPEAPKPRPKSSKKQLGFDFE